MFKPPLLQLLQLKNLLFTMNLLSGVLTKDKDGEVDVSQLHLAVPDLGNNHLTGTIPAGVFSIPALRVLELDSNCLSGTLPIEICSAPALSALLLDGASAAPACQNKILPLISTAYTLTKSQSMLI